MCVAVDKCPACHASFIGDMISLDRVEFYGGHAYFRLERQMYDKNRQLTGLYQCHACETFLHADGSVVETKDA